MKSKIEVFFISYLIWSLLVWPYSPVYGWDLQSIIAGFFAALPVALIFGKGFSEHPAEILRPRRWLYVLVFIPVFAYYCLKSTMQVAYQVLHPELPIRPGIVKIRTKLTNRAAIALLANCITLTPGTLTVEATEEGVLFVHWLDVVTADEEEAGRLIAGRFEYFLHRIFEEDD